MEFETNITFVILQNASGTLRSQQHFQTIQWQFSVGIFIFSQICYSIVGLQVVK